MSITFRPNTNYPNHYTNLINIYNNQLINETEKRRIFKKIAKTKFLIFLHCKIFPPDIVQEINQYFNNYIKQMLNTYTVSIQNIKHNISNEYKLFKKQQFFARESQKRYYNRIYSNEEFEHEL